jgi:hypothetical protein
VFYDKERGRAVSSIGWADRAAIWVFDCASRQIELIPIPDAKFVAVRRYGEVVRIVHFGGDTATIAIRTLSDLHHDAAVLRVAGDRPTFLGDARLWASIDACALLPTKKGTRLISIDAPSRSVRFLDLKWFLDGEYDLGYQGLFDCLSPPGLEYTIVSVQRSSRLVVLDIRKNEKLREISLADRGGNPLLTLLSGTEMLTTDYDTMCRVDLDSMSLVASQRLQGDSDKGGRHFVGDFSLDEAGVLLARPSSGDVVLLDPSHFSILDRAVTGGEPLQAVRVSSSAVLARDWKTGHPLEGAFGG